MVQGRVFVKEKGIIILLIAIWLMLMLKMRKKYKMRTKYIYLVVTNDEYELPIYIGGCPKEIAEYLGLKYQTVCARFCKSRIRKRNIGKWKIIKVINE